MAEHAPLNKPTKPYPRPLAEFLPKCVGEAFARQGFASSELVTHWADIVGQEIAGHTQPMKLSWPRRTDPDHAEPATLVLRAEGPAAIEIQHLAPIILTQVNRFLGWRAVGRISIRQAPLARPVKADRKPPPSREATETVRERLTDIADTALRDALARLGAAVGNA